MISKETFCKAMRLRDEQFNRDNHLALYFDTLFCRKGTHQALELPTFGEDAFYLIIGELFNVEPTIIRTSVDLEGSETAPMQVLGYDGKTHTINYYGELYDYLVERMEDMA